MSAAAGGGKLILRLKIVGPSQGGGDLGLQILPLRYSARHGVVVGFVLSWMGLGALVDPVSM